MSTADSEAYFLSRAKDLELSERAIEALKEARLTTANKLAFLLGYLPSTAEDANLNKELIQPILGENPPKAQSSALRQLFVEAYVLAIDAVHKRNARTPGDTPGRVTAEERGSRLKAFRGEYPGVQASGMWEPSTTLIEQCCQQHHDKAIVYIPWTACTSQPQEVLNRKKATNVLQIGIDRVVREHTVQPEFTTAAGTDLRVTMCLHRRGIAYHLSGLLTFSAHRQLVDALLNKYLEDPVPDFQPITWQQLRAADEYVFTRLAEITYAGKKEDGSSWFPCDAELLKILVSPAFDMKMHPRLMSYTSATTSSRMPSAPAAQTMQPPPVAADRRASDPPAKRRRTAPKRMGLPEAMVGCVSHTKERLPICFQYNLGTCASNKQPGERCNRGCRGSLASVKLGAEGNKSAAESPQAQPPIAHVVVAVCMTRGLAEQALASTNLEIAAFRVNSK
eukprot:3357249-Amphidinium_carterae.1